MNKRLIALTVIAAALLVPAAPVSADDGSVYKAWSARDAEQVKIGKRWQRAFRRWEKSKTRVWKPLYRANRAFVKYTAEVEAAVKAQSASTERGAETRTLALRTLRLYRVAYTNLGRAVRKAARGRIRAAKKQMKKAARQERRAIRSLRKTRRGFKALGFGS